MGIQHENRKIFIYGLTGAKNRYFCGPIVQECLEIKNLQTELNYLKVLLTFGGALHTHAHAYIHTCMNMCKYVMVKNIYVNNCKWLPPCLSMFIMFNMCVCVCVCVCVHVHNSSHPGTQPPTPWGEPQISKNVISLELIKII